MSQENLRLSIHVTLHPLPKRHALRREGALEDGVEKINNESSPGYRKQSMWEWRVGGVRGKQVAE